MQPLQERAPHHSTVEPLPELGAAVRSDGVHFRVWAPRCRSVDTVVLGAGSSDLRDPPRLTVPLEPEEDGYYAGTCADAAPGTRYAYRLDGRCAYPDPASR